MMMIVCPSAVKDDHDFLEGWPMAVGPEVAGESNPGSEGPPACGAHVSGC